MVNNRETCDLLVIQITLDSFISIFDIFIIPMMLYKDVSVNLHELVTIRNLYIDKYNEDNIFKAKSYISIFFRSTILMLKYVYFFAFLNYYYF